LQTYNINAHEALHSFWPYSVYFGVFLECSLLCVSHLTFAFVVLWCMWHIPVLLCSPYSYGCFTWSHRYCENASWSWCGCKHHRLCKLLLYYCSGLFCPVLFVLFVWISAYIRIHFVSLFFSLFFSLSLSLSVLMFQDKHTCLHYAAQNSRGLRLVQFLLERKANPIAKSEVSTTQMLWFNMIVIDCTV